MPLVPRSAARSYEDPCGIARALDVVGERWAMLVVRELVLGPRRFTDLRAALNGVSANVLTQRLDDLVAAGVVQKGGGAARTKASARSASAQPTSARASYELTAWGQKLRPVLLALGTWGAQSAPRQGTMSPDAFMLALEATFRPERAADFRVDVEVRLSGEPYAVVVADRKISIVRGAAPAPDVTIAADVATLRKVVFGDAVDPEAYRLSGDTKRGRAFLRLFARPAR